MRLLSADAWQSNSSTLPWTSTRPVTFQGPSSWLWSTTYKSLFLWSRSELWCSFWTTDQLAESRSSNSWESSLKFWTSRSVAEFMLLCKSSQSSRKWLMSFRLTVTNSSTKLLTWTKLGTTSKSLIMLACTSNSSKWAWWSQSSCNVWPSTVSL